MKMVESMVIIQKANRPIESIHLAPAVSGDKFADLGTAIGVGADSGDGVQRMTLSPPEVDSWLSWPSTPSSSASTTPSACAADPQSVAWTVGTTNRTQAFDVGGFEASVSFNLDHYRTVGDILADLTLPLSAPASVFTLISEAPSSPEFAAGVTAYLPQYWCYGERGWPNGYDLKQAWFAERACHEWVGYLWTPQFRELPVRALEIGAFEGGSATWLLHTVLHHPASTLTVIEPVVMDRLRENHLLKK